MKNSKRFVKHQIVFKGLKRTWETGDWIRNNVNVAIQNTYFEKIICAKDIVIITLKKIHESIYESELWRSSGYYIIATEIPKTAENPLNLK